MTLASVACTTPESVKKLTIEAGDASITLSNEMSKFSKTTRDITESRVAAIVNVKLALLDTESALNRDIKLNKTYNTIIEKQKTTLLAEIEKLIEDIINDSNTADIAANERKKILDDQTAINAPVKSYNDLGAALLKFSADDDILDRLEFMEGFINQVVDDVKKAQTDAKKSEKQAENMTKKANSKAKASVPVKKE